MDHKKSISQIIREELEEKGLPYAASDNISDVMTPHRCEQLIEEVEQKFAAVLDSLVIDRVNDHNSLDTPRRLAKMYVNEIMRGRYFEKPHATAFPNEGEDEYKSMLVVRAELTSMCSHHHQPVKGVCYIGLIPRGKVIGLSKYARIAQWCARRGTLQEELCNDISNEIKAATESKDVGVYIQATHGCMENRGVCANSSLTQTCVLSGLFHNDSVKKEFYDNIHLQQLHDGTR